MCRECDNDDDSYDYSEDPNFLSSTEYNSGSEYDD